MEGAAAWPMAASKELWWRLVDGLVARGHDSDVFCKRRLAHARALDLEQRLRGSSDRRAHRRTRRPSIPRCSGIVVRRARTNSTSVHFLPITRAFRLPRRLSCASLTTLHWRLGDALAEHALPAVRRHASVVPISAAQRAPLPWLNWRATVHHGLPPSTCCAFHEEPGDYVAFLGRIAPTKRPDRAIEIARRAGWPIRIAAKIDNGDRAYFEQEIAELFELPHVEYCGEVGDSDKNDFLGRARALLFPIDWPEALRPRDDRSARVRHAGDRLRSWRGA